MMNDRKLDEVLAELGREHRAMDVPETLERVLCAAASSRKDLFRMPRSRFTWALVAAAILLAGIATGLTLWQSRKNLQPMDQPAQSVPAPSHGLQPNFATAPVPVRQDLHLNSALVRKVRPIRVNLPGSSLKQSTWNSLDEFVALPVSEGLPAAAELSVVRVKLRGSDLQQYGLQAPADGRAQPLLAEFAVGEDGLPRAIRIVR
jgi:hypothetical protein